MTQEQRKDLLSQMHGVRDRFKQETDPTRRSYLFRAHCELFEALMMSDDSETCRKMGNIFGSALADSFDRLNAALGA